MQEKPTTWAQVRAALLSILIGFIISALTVLFQYAIGWLNNIPAEAPGAVVGMVKFLSWIKSHQLA